MAGDSKAKSGVSYQRNVWSLVKQIPKGKVATYGMIAKKAGIDPRMAGWALHANQSADIPCHRVVDRNGRLAPSFAGPPVPGAQAIGRRAFDGWREQRRRLLAEGVTFDDEMHVDLEKSLWQAYI